MLSTLLHNSLEKGACQLDILDRPSWGRELTCEAIFISIGYL